MEKKKQLLKERYEYIFEEKLLQEVTTRGIFKKVEAGTTIINLGDRVTHMPLVIEGAIKIVGEEEEGSEYLMYYLETGDSCAMTMSCCLAGRVSKVRAVAETPTLLYMIPIYYMEEWLIRYKSWRSFVFDSYDVRMKELLETVNSLAFDNLEGRLYKYLRDRALVLQSPSLDITHQQIANDLNTSRVVISRLMKKLIIDGKVTANRTQITVTEFLAKKEKSV
jgi:CRP/FNR family transcriptional regulator